LQANRRNIFTQNACFLPPPNYNIFCTFGRSCSKTAHLVFFRPSKMASNRGQKCAVLEQMGGGLKLANVRFWNKRPKKAVADLQKSCQLRCKITKQHFFPPKTSIYNSSMYPLIYLSIAGGEKRRREQEKNHIEVFCRKKCCFAFRSLV